MYNQLSLLLLALVVFSCSKEEIPTQEIPIPQTLVLNTPAEDTITSHCCLSFDWSDLDPEETYDFVLSYTSNFSDVMFEETTTSNSLTLDSFFIPGLKYYWKVEAKESELSAQSFFTVIDYGAKYAGLHILQQEYSSWLLGMGTTIDTTYKAEIVIQEMQIPLEDVGFIKIGDRRYKYIIPSEPNPNVISFYIEPQTPHYHYIGALYLQQDSIYLSEGLNANGGGYSKVTQGILME